MSRWSHWSRGEQDKPRFFGDLKEKMSTAAGNPSAAMGPAERARQLGLQSDGSGSYIDPQTGETVARTVNGELVFYDNNRATGGAISDGSGGAELTQAAPSWSDPTTGMVMVPPGKPESPEEHGAVPDSIPAQAPAGYNSFVNDMKMNAYKGQQQVDMANKIHANATADVNNPMQAAPAQGINPIGPDGKVHMGPGLGGGLPGVAEAVGDNADMRKITGDLPVVKKNFSQMRQQMKDVAQQDYAPQTPKPGFKYSGLIDTLFDKGTRQRGAGAKRMTHDELRALRKYVKEGPQNRTNKISDDEFTQAQEYLNDKLKGKTKTFYKRMMGKGTPPKDLMTDQRGLDVLRSYMENNGESAIDGSPLLFSMSELDHAQSLESGGKDDPSNWRWLPRNFNGYKSSLNDEDLLAKIEKDLSKDEADTNIRYAEDDHQNLTRFEWMDRFKEHGWSDLNVADIDQASGKFGMQFLKGLAEIAGVSRYKLNPGDKSDRHPTVALKPEELRQKLIDELGIPDSVDVENFDRGLFETLQKIEDSRSDLDSAKRARRLEKRQKK
jgi:hypothetical protein